MSNVLFIPFKIRSSTIHAWNLSLISIRVTTHSLLSVENKFRQFHERPEPKMFTFDIMQVQFVVLRNFGEIALLWKMKIIREGNNITEPGKMAGVYHCYTGKLEQWNTINVVSIK